MFDKADYGQRPPGDVGSGGSNNNNGSGHSVGHGWSNNLTATITSIRTNVTRVLNMYFQNVTQELGPEQQQQQQHAPNFATTTGAVGAPPGSHGGNNATTTSTSLPQRIANAIGVVSEAAAKLATTAAAATTTTTSSSSSSSSSSAPSSSLINSTTTASVPSATATLLATTTLRSQLTAATATATSLSPLNQATAAAPPADTPPTITYPSFREAIHSADNCSALFANYTQPQPGLFCNWTWDSYLCWPPTPAGVLARMRCPAGLHGIDTRKFAERHCEPDGSWRGRPTDLNNPVGWTNYTQCYKPEVTSLLQQIQDQDLIYAIAVRTRTMEIVGLVLSLCALLLSLVIFFNFRTLRNNRTKIHKNLFIAMVIQVIIRLTLYLDQAFTRGPQQAASNASVHGIDNTPYLCEASYVLLEYARTAMFMWMFIEGLYLHNVVTVKVFQGRFPHRAYSAIGWGVPVLMTAVWAMVTASKMEYSENEPCWWNYNLTVYYWILEGPRLLVMLVNFVFLLNIIRVLVVKLRQSQASDVEQARKAVRAAVVLLPLLGVTNLLYVMPPLGRPAWVFGVWAYLTYFLSSFQGFFIAVIYCFLNGEVRAALLKSLSVYMSVRGHSDWVPRRASMFSGAYNTGPETEAHAAKRNESSSSPLPPPAPAAAKSSRSNGRPSAVHCVGEGVPAYNNNPPNAVPPPPPAADPTPHGKHTRITAAGRGSNSNSNSNKNSNRKKANNNNTNNRNHNNNWMLTLCFRGQKNKCVMPSKKNPPQIFITTLA